MMTPLLRVITVAQSCAQPSHPVACLPPHYPSVRLSVFLSRLQDKHLPTVPSLMRAAVESGRVRFVACTMSMEALGIPSAALLPFVELGGVADYMGAASTAKNTLFI